MKYTVEITSSAQRQFKKLPESLQTQLITKILSLEENPRPIGVKKLQAFDYYRIRIGDYRVVYAINDKARRVKITQFNNEVQHLRKLASRCDKMSGLCQNPINT